MPRPRKRLRIKLKKDTLRAIIAFSLSFASIFLLVSNFLQAPVFSFVKGIFLPILGWGFLPFSIILLVYSLLLLPIKIRFVGGSTVLGLLAVISSLLGFFYPILPTSSGIYGQLLWEGTASLLTPIGAFLVLSFLFIVGVVIFLNTSLDQVVELVSTIISFLIKGLKKLFSFFKRDTKDLPQPLLIKTSKTDEKGKAKEKTSVALSEQVVANLPQNGKIWHYPPLSLLSEVKGGQARRGNVKGNAGIIEKTLESFGIRAKVVEVNLGPTVTRYALEIPLGTRLSKVTALQNDLALALAAPTGAIRIEAPIPGKSLVGVEIPNISPDLATLKSVLGSSSMRSNKSKLAVALGLDVSGNPTIADIAKMPHVLIAGATGSGKSVLLNGIISSLLFRNSPYELKMILVDPKRVELSDYNDIPHLLTPVIMELEKILSALKWALSEMDTRYKLFSQAGVRNIQEYNELSGFQAFPYIVVIVDELADLMAFAPVEVEDAICRLAQMSRATGIHLVVATQRPSVDVITGLIKANITCRISFNVASMIDSRVIIDQPGAEKLLGKGDMLYVPPDVSKPQRLQGVFVSQEEVRALINFIKDQGMMPEYTEEVIKMPVVTRQKTAVEDDLFDEAVRTVCQYDRASASLLQRRLRIGYARAARLLDQLESQGIVGPGEGAKPRDVLVRNAEEFLSQKETTEDE